MIVTYNYTKQNGETRDIVTDGRSEEFTPKYIKKNYPPIYEEDKNWVWVQHGLHWIPHTHARVYDTENQGWRTIFKNKINHSRTSFEDEVEGTEEEVEGEEILIPSDQETNTEPVEGILESINNRVIRIEELLESVIGSPCRCSGN
jgi:hypothetical protein